MVDKNQDTFFLVFYFVKSLDLPKMELIVYIDAHYYADVEENPLDIKCHKRFRITVGRGAVRNKLFGQIEFSSHLTSNYNIYSM